MKNLMNENVTEALVYCKEQHTIDVKGFVCGTLQVHIVGMVTVFFTNFIVQYLQVLHKLFRHLTEFCYFSIDVGYYRIVSAQYESAGTALQTNSM